MPDATRSRPRPPAWRSSWCLGGDRSAPSSPSAGCSPTRWSRPSTPGTTTSRAGSRASGRRPERRRGRRHLPRRDHRRHGRRRRRRPRALAVAALLPCRRSSSRCSSPGSAASTGWPRHSSHATGRRCGSSTRDWCPTTASRPATSPPPPRCTAASPCCCGCWRPRRGGGCGCCSCCPLLVALARLYQGAHHSTDVLASVAYTTAWLAVLVGRPAARDRPVSSGR